MVLTICCVNNSSKCFKRAASFIMSAECVCCNATSDVYLLCQPCCPSDKGKLPLHPVRVIKWRISGPGIHNVFL